jgi:bacillithiol system protein YtxJ
MNWKKLTFEVQLNEIIESSDSHPVLIFKHSTRCSISQMSLSRFERNWLSNSNVTYYYLDLLNYRPISNLIAEQFGVKHESPQTLLIVNGKCVNSLSHNAITFSEAVKV